MWLLWPAESYRWQVSNMCTELIPVIKTKILKMNDSYQILFSFLVFRNFFYILNQIWKLMQGFLVDFDSLLWHLHLGMCFASLFKLIRQHLPAFYCLCICFLMNCLEDLCFVQKYVKSKHFIPIPISICFKCNLTKAELYQKIGMSFT